MKTATGLTLIALGAILAFAVTKEPSFFNLHAAGWVLMATGGIGLVVPRSRYGRLRKRTVTRTENGEQEVTIDEAEMEPQFSSLLAPGGIDTRLSAPATEPGQPDEVYLATPDGPELAEALPVESELAESEPVESEPAESEPAEPEAAAPAPTHPQHTDPEHIDDEPAAV